ncbi:hypothetical protein GQ53DRAFT_788420 [Thozetella sp. PMI_491]|nr:hypothetical protein GQ53DRAFT_788420 [Thozetella sp. PMI_491]
MRLTVAAGTLALFGSAQGIAIAPRADIWKPTVGASWQIILTGQLDIGASTQSITPNVDVFDIDLFYNTKNGSDKTIIDALHRLGKKVICYFSAGSFEPDRPDSGSFQAADRGRNMTQWPKEQWLNYNNDNVHKIMAARIKMAADMGCDAIDPDNVDGYGENGGKNPTFTLTQTDSINFVKFLASEAKKNNLAIGLKNAGEIIPDVLSVVDFSVNEECASRTVAECSTFRAFPDATPKKPVFHIEYPNSGSNNPSSTTPVTDTNPWCKSESEDGENVNISDFSTVIKNYDLNGWVQLCDKSVATTPTKSVS